MRKRRMTRNDNFGIFKIKDLKKHKKKQIPISTFNCQTVVSAVVNFAVELGFWVMGDLLTL